MITTAEGEAILKSCRDKTKDKRSLVDVPVSKELPYSVSGIKYTETGHKIEY